MTRTEKMIDLLSRIVLNADEKATAAEELKAMLDGLDPEKHEDDLDREVERLLIEVGVPCHITGYSNLKKAITLAVNNPTLRHATTLLYGKAAEEAEYETTASRVERSIRHAVELTWSRGDMDVLNKYFGNTVSPDKGKPTNAEFIATMTREIRHRTAR